VRILLSAVLVLAGIGAVPGAAHAAPAYTTAPDARVFANTQLAPGLTLTDFTTGGPNKGDILTADLSESTLKPKYLDPGTVDSTTALTTQANRVGAVAAVNGDFFDIGATGAPRGIGIDGGTLLNGPSGGWNEAAALYAAGSGTRGGLAQIFLDGTVTLPGGTTLTATNLNSPNIAANGIGIYNELWGSAARGQTLDGATRSREIEITDGAVTKVSTSPGGKVAAGTVVVLGVNAGADALASTKVGDAVTVNYKPRGSDGAQVAIGGNLVLLKDGVATTTAHPDNPRTAIGFSATGVVDSHTWTALLSVGDTPVLRNGSTGYPVTRLQRALTAALSRGVGIDGGFGSVTGQAVHDYQSSRRLGTDGICGSQTWAALRTGK
jgi:Putative peptidoglycan binding domain/Phosphodiester glycosidase